MTDDNPCFKPYYQNGGWTYESSASAGRDQASNGQPCSPQQWNETSVDYETRVSNYDWAKQNQG